MSTGQSSNIGAASRYSELKDTDTTGLIDGYVPIYDASKQMWGVGPPGGNVGTGDLNQLGNSFAAPISIGANDNNTVSIRVNGLDRWTVENSGNAELVTSSTYAGRIGTRNETGLDVGQPMSVTGGNAEVGAGGNVQIVAGTSINGQGGSVIVQSSGGLNDGDIVFRHGAISHFTIEGVNGRLTSDVPNYETLVTSGTDNTIVNRKYVDDAVAAVVPPAVIVSAGSLELAGSAVAQPLTFNVWNKLTSLSIGWVQGDFAAAGVGEIQYTGPAKRFKVDFSISCFCDQVDRVVRHALIDLASPTVPFGGLVVNNYTLNNTIEPFCSSNISRILELQSGQTFYIANLLGENTVPLATTVTPTDGSVVFTEL